MDTQFNQPQLVFDAPLGVTPYWGDCTYSELGEARVGDSHWVALGEPRVGEQAIRIVRRQKIDSLSWCDLLHGA